MSDPIPQAARRWLALTLDQRLALVDHHTRGCRHCGHRTGTWTDSLGIHRCRTCWGPVAGDEEDAAA